MTDPAAIEQLLERYRDLLGLYRRMEDVSNRLNEAISQRRGMEGLRDSLRDKLALAESIQSISRDIAVNKQELTFTHSDRERIRRVEAELSAVVGRVIEREEQGEALYRQQGVRLARR